MTGVIVVLPKLDDAKNIKNLLVRNGISVSGACSTGAQASALADNLDSGIVICGYKMPDMMYLQLLEYLPAGFEMLLLASAHIISGGYVESHVMCLSMPIKVHDLISTVDMMTHAVAQRRRRQKAQPRERDSEEVKLIREAKAVLMVRNHMSEKEAHKYIQKCSMDSGTNMVETAQMVLSLMRG